MGVEGKHPKPSPSIELWGNIPPYIKKLFILLQNRLTLTYSFNQPKYQITT